MTTVVVIVFSVRPMGLAVPDIAKEILSPTFPMAAVHLTVAVESVIVSLSVIRSKIKTGLVKIYRENTKQSSSFIHRGMCLCNDDGDACGTCNASGISCLNGYRFLLVSMHIPCVLHIAAKRVARSL